MALNLADMTPLEENHNRPSRAAHVFLPHGIVDAFPQAASGSLTKHLHLDGFLHSVKFGSTLL
jgi:hypothetical protein